MTSSNIYCTYVTFYSGNKLPPFYIGSSTVKKVESGYHGSVASKKWKNIYLSELLSYPELFKTEIISIFQTREEALKHELELHISNNVVRSKWFYNESYASPNGCFGADFSGDAHWNYGGIGTFSGKTHSIESKKKIRESNIGKTGTWAGKTRPDQSIKMAGQNNPMFGKRFKRNSLWCCINCRKELSILKHTVCKSEFSVDRKI